jgi:type IV secretory pathway VirB10-like protein
MLSWCITIITSHTEVARKRTWLFHSRPRLKNTRLKNVGGLTKARRRTIKKNVFLHCFKLDSIDTHFQFQQQNKTKQNKTNKSTMTEAMNTTEAEVLAATAAEEATTTTNGSGAAEEEDDDEEEDLEKLQKEIERMEAEAARITKETDELDKKKDDKSGSGAAAGTKAAGDGETPNRDG